MEATIIANTILKRAWGKAIYVNPSKLQSLLYFTQGFCLKYDCDIIVDEDFYKKETGVINYNVYDIFNKYSYNNIESLEKGLENHIYSVSPNKSPFFIEILDDVIASYGQSEAHLLSYLIEYHNKIRNIKIKTGQLISKDIIKETFKDLLYGE